MEHPDIKYLAEMMNYSGVLSDDDEVLKKYNIQKITTNPLMVMHQLSKEMI